MTEPFIHPERRSQIKINKERQALTSTTQYSREANESRGERIERRTNREANELRGEGIERRTNQEVNESRGERQNGKEERKGRHTRRKRRGKRERITRNKEKSI